MESTEPVLETAVPEMVEPYRAALNGDWEGMKRFYEQDPRAVYRSLTVTNDNALLIAVYSGTRQPLESLLQINSDAIALENDHKNNALHEAAAIGNTEAAKLLVSRNKQLLVAQNILGETPLFRAAAFGSIEIVKFLASKVKDEQQDGQIHCTRNDSTSILHIAIQGEHFETALWLLNNFIDGNFADFRDRFGFSCLQVLAKMPNSFKSGYPMNMFKEFLYYCLPSVDYNHEFRGKEDLESGDERTKHSQLRCSPVHTVFPNINETWKQKRKHEFAFEVARMFICEDKSWKQSHTRPEVGAICFGGRASIAEDQLPHCHEACLTLDTTEPEASLTPLLMATSTGIKEIVIEILAVFPQAVEHVSYTGETILHMAIKHRQLEIYHLVKNMRIAMPRLIRKIDDKDSTILHHAANMDFYRGNQPNATLQLQDELFWFQRVQNITPPYYAMHHNKDNFTPKELFGKTHEKLHQDAQNWIKKTSESSSVIAVLIATVVFAAAYTVPGGSDSKTGRPNLSGETFFTVFTVMDVVALVTSLTAVVMFMSIITSPFCLQDFEQSLPRKLTLGLTFLFLSVVTTMLAFAATVVIIIHLKEQWLTTLVYTVAFVPVTVFALLQFPLYFSFIGTLKYSLHAIKRTLPWCIVRCFSRTSNTYSYT